MESSNLILKNKYLEEIEMSDTIERMRKSLYEFAIKDINIAMNHNAPIGAFILASCLIDCLAGFRYGVPENFKGSRQRYIKFIDEYYDNKYEGKVMYDSMRNRLVHNYAERGSYLFSHKNELEHNFKYDGKINIESDEFIKDLELAMKKYFNDLEKDPDLQRIAKERMDFLSIIEERVVSGSSANTADPGPSGTTYKSTTVNKKPGDKN